MFRTIQTDFWRDLFFLDLTPESKYFYMYLLTNSSCKQCGIYTLIPKFAAVELGYSEETVIALIDRFCKYGKILYNDDNGEVMILNWYKYNINIKNRNSRVCINNCLRNIKTTEFVRSLYSLCVEHYEKDIDLVREMFHGVKLEKKESKPSILNNNLKEALDNTCENSKEDLDFTVETPKHIEEKAINEDKEQNQNSTLNTQEEKASQTKKQSYKVESDKVSSRYTKKPINIAFKPKCTIREKLTKANGKELTVDQINFFKQIFDLDAIVDGS